MHKIIMVLACFIVLLGYSFSCAQSNLFLYKMGSNVIQSNEGNITHSQINKYYDIRKSLPKGYVNDGSVDYTRYIQKGIDENSNVLMPTFPLLINEDGLKVKDGSRIIFQEESLLKMKPNSLPYYAVLKVFNVRDVIIESPKIVGDRNLHKGLNGEWGMGIHVQASENIRILSPSVTDCWGDGIYIGGDVTNPNKNITVTNANIDNCRRNGISVTDGNGIQILNPIISNMRGTPPMAGIDIEPNNDSAVIDNILISNPQTISNENFGIVISLGQLPSKATKTVRIQIDNHIDRGSNTAFCLASFRGAYENKVALSGLIEVNNPQWYNNKKTLVTGNYKLGPTTRFKNIKIYKDGSQTYNIPSQLDELKLKREQSKHINIFIEN